MRVALVLSLALLFGACSSNSESNLPVQGTLAAKKDDASERYQVTWSGISSYNQGACEVNQPCVHLRRTVNVDNRTEVAVTLAVFDRQYTRLNQ
ncbi:MAG: hypothetical protein HKN29_15820 [Rhodothermales bacterium]|nr:hypothetical protein [Rhodothermales bacterium]